MNAKTKVVFRVWETGDVVAIFPQIAATNHWPDCLSYESCGQHGACDPFGLTCTLRLATPSEYRLLATELRRRGYKLDIRTRITQTDAAIRKAQIKDAL